jgi:HAD superfamily hydrolase (TIGR01490 family)
LMVDSGHNVIAFFDLDHTLLDGSNGGLYARAMVRQGFMKPSSLVWVTWYTILYRLNRLPRSEVYRRTLDAMGQYPVLKMIELMDKGFEEAIMPRLYRGGVDLIRQHKEKGHRTVIATAAGEYIAERVRVQVEADDVIATPIPVKGDHITGELEGPTAFMEGKLEMAEEFAAVHGADLSGCYFYSDSASDLPLLEAVGHPVMVNPQLKLRLATRGRGWPIIRFKEYAKFDGVRRPERLITPEMDRFTKIYEASLSAD